MKNKMKTNKCMDTWRPNYIETTPNDFKVMCIYQV